MKNKNILLTGCLGFIGSQTAEKLINDGHFVFGIDPGETPLHKARLNQLRVAAFMQAGEELSEDYNLDELKFVCTRWDAGLYLSSYAGNPPIVNNPEHQKIDTVIHLGAWPGVRKSINNPAGYYENNTVETAKVLQWAKRNGVEKVVFASTSSAYDWKFAPYKPIPEQTQHIEPLHPYSGSKLAAEDLCQMYHELHGLDITVLRYFTVYGPSGRPDMMPFKVIRWINEGEPIHLNGDGNQERDFTYIDDVVDANIAAIDHRSGFEIFNIGKGEPHTINELIGFAEKYSGKTAKIEYHESNNLDASFTFADNSKARDILGWRPDIDLDAGIYKTVEWYQKNQEFLKGV